MELAGEEAAAQRRVRHERDAQLAAHRQRLLALLAIQQRELRLDGGEGVHRVTPADRRGRRLAETDRARLAPLDQPRHRAHGLLDGHARIDPVLIVEVDHVHPQPLEARVAGLGHVLGPSVDEVAAPGGILDLAELGGDEHLVAPAPDGLADQLLVLSPAVHVRGVEVIDAPIERVMDDGGRLGVVGLAVHPRHPHAPEPDGRHAEAALTQ